jgi:Peptidase family M48
MKEKRMKSKYYLSCLFIALAISIPLQAQDPASNSDAPSVSVDRVIDKAIEQERALMNRMKGMRPLIETYTQNMGLHPDLGAVPKSDKYFLGKLDLTNGTHQKSLLADSNGWISSLGQRIKQLYSVSYVPDGFAATILLGQNFQKNLYDFTYVRREFLGEVRCLVFDVQPKKGTRAVAFLGRIWIEDRDLNIVRFNGTYTPSSASNLYFHFDSWRENMGPGLWLPAYVYAEESDLPYFMGTRKLRFKGQTRLWGYNVGRAKQQNELTSLTVESDNVQDKAADDDTITPVEAFRAWERQAEDNVLQRLEVASLLAPDGPVNKVLETVVNNLEITNNLDIQPPIRARVLLTTPVESFTVGHTIILSRGLIDVLPDEASLALALAHELAHISLGHSLDTKYAFNDRTLFRDEDTLMQLSLQRTQAEETEADKSGLEFLKNSPYKDKLSNAALFLSAVQDRSSELPGLLHPHLGNQIASNGKVRRMPDLIPQAPKLEMKRTDQIAALPLGSRVQVDLWNNTIKLMKSKNVPLQSAREKMPFEVTPVFLYLTRQQQPSQATAQTR